MEGLLSTWPTLFILFYYISILFSCIKKNKGCSMFFGKSLSKLPQAHHLLQYW